MNQGRALHVDQLNGTSLKWGRDGELSPLDQQRILQLLCDADPVAESLLAGVTGADCPQPPGADYAATQGQSDLAVIV